MVKVAFTGSFDPPHEGHRYVVDTVKNLGFEVIVFVANNANKTYSKSLDSRADNAKEFFIGCKVVKADSENIGDTIKSEGCSTIVRGLRNGEDFEYEQKVSDFNLVVNGLVTIYIPCPEELRDISSTKLRCS